MRFTDELRESVAKSWDAVVHHPFTDALAAGTLDPAKMRRYLIQDHRFIDRFVVLLASAVAHAPSLADRIPGCQFLALVTGPENTYFERSFVALGVREDERRDTPDASATADFKALMREAALSGSYARMLAVLVVAEWSYLAWADRVKHRRPSQFWHAEWIDLHTGPYFESVVGWLRSQLDAVGPALVDKERSQVRADFARAVALEKAFFDHAWRH
jgi:thiaminase/transcriptional activator TenA